MQNQIHPARLILIPSDLTACGDDNPESPEAAEEPEEPRHRRGAPKRARGRAPESIRMNRSWPLKFGVLALTGLGLAAQLSGCGDGAESTGGSGASNTGAGGAGAGGAGGAGGTGGTGGMDACPTGYDDCDGNPDTVCETPTATSVSDCGACGEVCPAGAENQEAVCVASVCGLVCESGFEDCDGAAANGCEAFADQCGIVTVAPNVDAPIGLAVDDTHLYYGSKGHPPDFLDGEIWRTLKDGTGTPELIASGQNRPLNITIDDTHVYWSNGATPPAAYGSIVRAPKSGGAFQVLAEAMLRPGNPIVVGDTIYWTVKEPGEILSTAIDGDGNGGLGVVSTVVTGLAEPRDLAFHDGALYWATAGLPPSDGPVIARKFLPAGSEQTLATSIDDPSYKIAIDADNVYVGSFATNEVLAVPLLGGLPVPLAVNIGAPSEIVVDDSMVYFTTGDGNAVLKVPITGSDETLVALGNAYTSYLTQDADFVYWTAGYLNDPGGNIMRAPK